MKKHFASLLFLLSSTAFVSSPALSMNDFDAESFAIGHAPRRDPLESIKVDYEAVVRNYNLLRDKGNRAPDPELVGFLFGVENWKKLPRFYQKQLVGGVVEKALDLRLETLMSEAGVVPKYRAIRPKNDASDEELIAYLFGARWEQVRQDRREMVIEKVIRNAQTLDIEEPIAQSGVLEKYRSVRASGNKAPDKDLVGFLFGERWGKINPKIQEEIVQRVSGTSLEMDRDALFALIRSGKLEEAFRTIKETDTTDALPDELIVMQALENIGFDGWDRLPEGAYGFLIDAAKKNPEFVLATFVEDEKTQAEVVKTFRAIKNSGNKSSDADIVKYVLGQMGYKYWEGLTPKLQGRAVKEIIKSAEQSLVPDWIHNARSFFDESQLNPLFVGIPDEYVRERIIATARDIDTEVADIAPRVAALVKYKGVLLPQEMSVPERANTIETLLSCDPALIEILAQNKNMFEGVDLWDYREIIGTLSHTDVQRVQAFVQHKDAFITPEMDRRDIVRVVETLMEGDASQIKTAALGARLMPSNSGEYAGFLDFLMRSNDEQRVQAIVQHKDAFITVGMDGQEIARVVGTLMQGDAGQIKTAALGAKLVPSTSYGYYDFLELLLRSDLARVQFVVQNANIFSADFDILAIFEQDMAKLQALVEAVKVLIPEDEEQYFRRALIGAFVRSDAATLQILIKNKKMFFHEGMSPYTRQDMVRVVVGAGVARAQAFVQQKDVLFTDTMDENTRSRIVFNILSSEVSADGIGLIGAVLTMHGATLFPVDLDNEDRAQIIEAAFRCDAAELDNRVAAIEANAPVLLKDIKGRDYAEVLISALGIEAREIGVRAVAIHRNEKAYFTGIEKENVGRLTVVLLNADAPRIDGLAPSLNVLLQNIRDSGSRVRGIDLLLKAEPDRVLALIKHKDMLLKDVSDWQLNRILETALALSVEELDHRVPAITNLLLPGNLCAKLLDRSLDSLRRNDLQALLEKGVEEIRAWEAAIGRNVPTFMSAHFAKSLVGTYDAYVILRNLIAVPANEIDSRGEGINHYANVLFPPEINDDANRAEIMAAVIKVKRDQLDKGIAKIAAAYATVDGKADSRARAQVIINNLPGRYY